jgi:hypothetical protein
LFGIDIQVEDALKNIVILRKRSELGRKRKIEKEETNKRTS